MLSTSSISGSLTLQAAGLVALADLSAVSLRTALMGTASYLDILVLAPGMHQQQSADEVNRGEFPMTGSMTTGNIFRVENPATVRYLQNISHTGCLVTARVSPKPPSSLIIPLSLLYLLCPVLTIIVFALLGAIRDWWGLMVLATLVFARMINVVVIKRRSREDWKGAKEEGDIDLFVLLSQDRWVRLQGTINNLKTATAGQWLRDQTAEESFATGVATLLVYASAVLAGNASTVGSLLIACLLLCTVALLALCNSSTKCLQMYDCVVQKVEGSLRKYPRRMEVVKDLIHETRRSDWAVGMELITSDEEAEILRWRPPLKWRNNGTLARNRHIRR
ncbi:hypothetical protein DFS33DRAFT_1375876 [Desarmillaria ectypa]|nr:hypothetical protein DFS33DRAFT_1375876 [Desarmillaria ectypa]